MHPYSLIRNLLPQRWDVLRLYWALKEFGKVFNRPLEIAINRFGLSRSAFD